MNEDLQSRDVGEDGFAEEEVMESRRSKLVPYGLLSSSSFHMLPGRNASQQCSCESRSTMTIHDNVSGVNQTHVQLSPALVPSSTTARPDAGRGRGSDQAVVAQLIRRKSSRHYANTVDMPCWVCDQFTMNTYGGWVFVVFGRYRCRADVLWSSRLGALSWSLPLQ